MQPGGARLQTLLDAVDLIVRDRMAEHLASLAAFQLCVARPPAASIRTLREIARGPRLYCEFSVLAALQRQVVQERVPTSRDIANSLP